MANGIRTYGPGKFYTLLDSYAYGVTLDGGADREASYEEGQGWYGFLGIDPDTVERIREEALEHSDQLTREEGELLRSSVAVIFFERSDGIVESDWYDRISEADAAWDQVEAEVEGEDEGEDAFSEEQMYEGYTIQDARRGGYEVAHEGKLVDTYDDMDEALKDINARMEREQFWPNIYYVNERGNIDLLDSSGNIIESRV